MGGGLGLDDGEHVEAADFGAAAGAVYGCGSGVTVSWNAHCHGVGVIAAGCHGDTVTVISASIYYYAVGVITGARNADVCGIAFDADAST